MAASPTPRPAAADLRTAPPALRAALESWRGLSDPRIDSHLLGPSGQARCALAGAVAFSGGADSTALLRAACLLYPGRVIALHVHHGLQAAADDFSRHCQRLCDAWQVPLQVLHVHARRNPGESPEDAARRARYAALAKAAREAGAARVWLGHHADDQLETLLLALSRGAGLPGLSAMPASFIREAICFERPLLAVPGADVRAWLQTDGVPWIDDPSNTDTAYTRNRLRLQVIPALMSAFPQARETFARSARHAAQAQALLDDLAAQDLAGLAAETGGPVQSSAHEIRAQGLPLARLQCLSRLRQANLLRHWLRQDYRTAPSAAQLEELLDQIDACRTRGHRIDLRVGAGRVLRVSESLVYEPGPG